MSSTGYPAPDRLSKQSRREISKTLQVSSRLFCLFELDGVLKILEKTLLGRTHCFTAKTQESTFS
jgi:hypothetical protein